MATHSLHCSCLENPMDRGAWQATVHGIVRVGPDLVLSLFLSTGEEGDESYYCIVFQTLFPYSLFLLSINLVYWLLLSC